MKSIKRYYQLKADVEDIYNALTNQKMIEIWTGEAAVMQVEPNSDFSIFGGAVQGKNIEFEKNKKIVQHWYFGDTDNPSEVTIILHPDKNKTNVELRQNNIPEDAYENMSEGWDEDYFGALKALFN